MQIKTRLNLDYVLKVSNEFDKKRTFRRNHFKDITKQVKKVNNCLNNGVERVRSIYLMKAGKSNYKIGIAINPNKRVGGVQTGNPLKVELLHSVRTYRALPIERLLHLIFLKHKLEGEWFKFNRFDIPYIIRVIDNLAVVPADKNSLQAKHLI